MEEYNYRALLAWISSVENKKFVSFRDIWDGIVFKNILKKIENFTVTDFKNYDEEKQWAYVLSNLNKLYKDLGNFYRFHLQKMSFDNNFANMLMISQNKDSQQIYNFALQVFGAAVQSKNRQMFILPIMQLQSDDQQTLKGLIQKFKFGMADQSSVLRQDTSSNQKLVLLSKVQSLQVQNEKLENQVEAVLKIKKQIQQKYKKLLKEYKKLKQQYQNNLFELESQPQSQIKVSAHMQGLNAQLVQELKTKLLEQATSFNKEKAQMQDTIDFLKQKIQKKQQQFYTSDKNGVPIALNAMPVADHPPCISLQKHQQLILTQSNKIKQIMKKEMDSSIENINLKKQVQGLNREIDKMKNEFIKKSDAISRDDYHNVKLNVLELLRDKFKADANKLRQRRRQIELE